MSDGEQATIQQPDPHAGHAHEASSVDWDSPGMIAVYIALITAVVAPSFTMWWRYHVRIRAAKHLRSAAEMKERAAEIERKALTGEKTDPTLER